MRIHNVRLGLATNSSSSHSLIFMKGVQDNWDGDSRFGWDTFTLASREAKARYLSVVLWENIDAAPEVKNVILNELLGTVPDPDGYIDHQSSIDLPRAFGQKYADHQFVTDFRDYILQDGLVILGGNDNGGEHPLAFAGTNFELPNQIVESDKTAMVCRKDSRGFWTVFNQYTGGKVRFSFTGNLKDPAPEKADAPELVDIKITDFCPYDCPFCYQNSTGDGKHNTLDMYWVVQALADMKVFEVAIGGGEPTLHPDFIKILRDFRHYGIVPNFTTKNMTWLRDPEQRAQIMEYAGSFAYSVQTPAEIEKLYGLLIAAGISVQRVNLQVVMGLDSRYGLENLLSAAHKFGFRVTLLGYKETGRGKTHKANDYSWWLSSAMALREKRELPTLCIDTAIAAQYEQAILDADIPKWMFHTQEGRFSCYIDAVEGKIGPSSYCAPEQMVKVNDVRDLRDEIASAFAGFAIEAPGNAAADENAGSGR